MNKKIILALAPTGGWGKDYNNPLEPEEITRQVIACVEEGVSLVHLHARDSKGELTTDLSNFSKTIELITNKCSVIIEASTGGLSSLTPQERSLPLQNEKVELGSLNMGSLNFLDKVYINTVPDIQLWLQKMIKNNIKPSIEIFDTSNIIISNSLIKKGLIKPQYNYNFVFNYKWGMSFSLSLIEVLKSMLPKESIWGVVFGESRNFLSHLQACLQGATMVRVGFEDSKVCNNREAEINLELVKEIRRELEILGFETATPKEARKLLGII
ncbi:MAG TPA: 3-keto-5-aminohexanoate cleavage protein [Candidatus Atribacteria bacterium]|nr:3-keto-5-aminohexanoate cleavage protein [Candidatus Atribacteria bacterium]